MFTKPLRIGDVVLENRVVLAPMAGVTNQAFRKIVKSFNIGLVYGEMVSDQAINYRNERTLKMTEIEPDEHPISMQLFGADKDSLVRAAQYLDQETECDLIDLNMGCPVTKVVKNGAGSALMKEPEKAFEIMKALVDSVEKPVTVKIRAGWDLKNINAVEIAKLAEKAGVSAIAVHPRTRTQMYEGHSDWQIIKEVKENVSIPVIGNGDIKSFADAKKMVELTGCDAVMIGRGAFGNPWLIQEIISGFQGQEAPSVDVAEIESMLFDHLDELIALKGESVAIKEMRSHASWYISGLSYSKKIKAVINRVSDRQTFETLLKDYFRLVKKGEALTEKEITGLTDSIINKCK